MTINCSRFSLSDKGKMNCKHLSPSDLKNLAIELRKRRGWSQEDVGDMVGISRSNVSDAENNPSSRVNTLVRMIEETSDFQFAEESRRRVKHNPHRDFSGRIFERLRYHMPMLFYFHHYRSCHLLDLQLQFLDYSAPENEGAYVKTESVNGLEEVRLHAGKMDKGAAKALQDLLDEGLVRIDELDVYEEKDHSGPTEKYLKNMSRVAPFEPSKPKYLNQIGSTPGIQKEGCWQIVDGEKETLEGKRVYLTFLADSEVTEIVKGKLGGVYSKLREERGEDEGMPTNAKIV